MMSLTFGLFTQVSKFRALWVVGLWSGMGSEWGGGGEGEDQFFKARLLKERISFHNSTNGRKTWKLM